jgi:hypothetical protein
VDPDARAIELVFERRRRVRPAPCPRRRRSRRASAESVETPGRRSARASSSPAPRRARAWATGDAPGIAARCAGGRDARRAGDRLISTPSTAPWRSSPKITRIRKACSSRARGRTGRAARAWAADPAPAAVDTRANASSTSRSSMTAHPPGPRRARRRPPRRRRDAAHRVDPLRNATAMSISSGARTQERGEAIDLLEASAGLRDRLNAAARSARRIPGIALNLDRGPTGGSSRLRSRAVGPAGASRLRSGRSSGMTRIGISTDPDLSAPSSEAGGCRRRAERSPAGSRGHGHGRGSPAQVIGVGVKIRSTRWDAGCALHRPRHPRVPFPRNRVHRGAIATTLVAASSSRRRSIMIAREGCKASADLFQDVVTRKTHGQPVAIEANQQHSPIDGASGFAERAAEAEEQAGERRTRLTPGRDCVGSAAIDVARVRRQLFTPVERGRRSRNVCARARGDP